MRYRRHTSRALACALWVASLTAGCAGHAAHTVEARRALDAHQPEEALTLYNKALGVSSGDELPKDLSGDQPLFLLDRSTVQQQLQRFEASSQDLETADKRVEMLDFSRSTAHEIGRYLFSDETGPYKARPYEKLLINTLNMVNYLARGHLQGAKVEARRLAIMQKYLNQAEDDPAQALLGPGSYLAGFVFEQAEEPGEAIRFYDEALRFAAYPSLAEPVRRLAPYSGYRTPRLRELLAQGDPAPVPEGSGELLVVVSYGRVPALTAERVPIGLALSLGALYLDPSQQMAARRMAGQGLVTWVNYPALEGAPRHYPLPRVQVDAQGVELDPPTNVDALVRDAYERAKGPMIASAITRMITRGAVGAGVGTGVAKGSGSSALGVLLAIGTQAAMSAADTPDTRSWATLPAQISIARLRLPAGQHRVDVSVSGVVRQQLVEVPASGFALVSVTELSQN